MIFTCFGFNIKCHYFCGLKKRLVSFHFVPLKAFVFCSDIINIISFVLFNNVTVVVAVYEKLIKIASANAILQSHDWLTDQSIFDSDTILFCLCIRQ